MARVLFIAPPYHCWGVQVIGTCPPLQLAYLAGAAEAAVCVLAMENSLIPPTINLTDPDPACDLDYVPNVARNVEVRAAMSNSFGFGGHNATILFARP